MEAVLRFAITELDVQPRVPAWETVLAHCRYAILPSFRVFHFVFNRVWRCLSGPIG